MLQGQQPWWAGLGARVFGDWPGQGGIRYSASTQSTPGLVSPSGVERWGLSLAQGGGLTCLCLPPPSKCPPSVLHFPLLCEDPSHQPFTHLSSYYILNLLILASENVAPSISFLSGVERSPEPQGRACVPVQLVRTDNSLGVEFIGAPASQQGCLQTGTWSSTSRAETPDTQERCHGF